MLSFEEVYDDLVNRWTDFVDSSLYNDLVKDWADLCQGSKKNKPPLKKQIFVINGSGGVGKDTFVDYVAELVPTKKISVVDYTKHVAESIGWKGAKDDEARKFLCDLKNLIDNYNDKNYETVRSFTKMFLDDDKTEFLFVSMREPEQIKKFVKEFGAKTILITSKRVAPVKTNEADASVANMKYDVYITNDGTLKDLKAQAVVFVKNHRFSEKHRFKKGEAVYVSHPYQGLESNVESVEKIVNILQEKYPDTIFVSPIHCFGFQYKTLPWDVGLERCLWLLERCDVMLDCDMLKTSKGCKAEREYCEKNKIPYRSLEDVE